MGRRGSGASVSSAKRETLSTGGVALARASEMYVEDASAVVHEQPIEEEDGNFTTRARGDEEVHE